MFEINTPWVFTKKGKKQKETDSESLKAKAAIGRSPLGWLDEAKGTGQAADRDAGVQVCLQGTEELRMASSPHAQEDRTRFPSLSHVPHHV